jgi:hypothetical protein
MISDHTLMIKKIDIVKKGSTIVIVLPIRKGPLVLIRSVLNQVRVVINFDLRKW